MRAKVKRSTSILSISKRSLFVLLIKILFSTYSFSQSGDDTLLIVHDRVIMKNEFLYYFQKRNQDVNEQNITDYLDSFINFQLKLADARDERVHQNIAFINELTEYRLQLAAPYLTDKEKEENEAAESKDTQVNMIGNSLVEKLKKEWNFKENLSALEVICNLADERVYKGNWIVPSNQSLNETLFFIDGKSIYQNDFIDFMQNRQTLNKNLSVRDYIISLYREFVSKRLILYENYKLDEKYPEFRFQYGEYRDAMLLDQITKKRVWFKADSDRKGLEDFFAENRENYKSKDSLSAIIVTSPDIKEAKHISGRVSKSLNRGEEDIHKVLNQLKNETGSHRLILEEGNFAKGDNPLIDQIKWKTGISKIKTFGGKYYFVIVENIFEPKYQNLNDVSEIVLNDYQNYLMDKWLAELKNKYRIQINEEVLSTIK